MVLAAGFGTRMRPLTNTRPKALIPLRGRPMIDYALDHLASAGVVRAVVNLHYRGEMLRAHLSSRRRPEIRFSEEYPKILDTGGGILNALALLGPAAFFAINTDTIWTGPNPLERLARAWDGTAMDALLLLVPRGQALGYTRSGDFFLDGEGAEPRRRAAAPEAPFVFTGAQILSPRAFDGFRPGAFSLNSVWDRLLDRGLLRAVIYPGPWIDVGTPESLDLAEAVLAEAAG